MISRTELKRFRYYFWDLPLWGWGLRTHAQEARILRFLEPEIDLIRNGFLKLFGYIERSSDGSEIEELVRKALWIKIVRESDAFTALKMSKQNLYRYFRIEGIEHLEEACGSNRPVILLTAHLGSFYTLSIPASFSGIPIYPIARTVNKSPDSPLAWQLYAKANYAFTEKRLLSHYIYTNFSGRIDRSIIALLKNGKTFLGLLDLPPTLYPYKRVPVKFLGIPSSLPSGLIQLGIKYNAIFMTAWNLIEHNDAGNFYRTLKIENRLPDSLNISEILQCYADRLSDIIMEEPWQWMCIPIVNQFDESEYNHG